MQTDLGNNLHFAKQGLMDPSPVIQGDVIPLIPREESINPVPSFRRQIEALIGRPSILSFRPPFVISEPLSSPESHSLARPTTHASHILISDTR